MINTNIHATDRQHLPKEQNDIWSANMNKGMGEKLLEAEHLMKKANKVMPHHPPVCLLLLVAPAVTMTHLHPKARGLITCTLWLLCTSALCISQLWSPSLLDFRLKPDWEGAAPLFEKAALAYKVGRLGASAGSLACRTVSNGAMEIMNQQASQAAWLLLRCLCCCNACLLHLVMHGNPSGAPVCAKL